MEIAIEPWHEIHSGMGRKDILAHMNKHGVRFLRLQFTDIAGINKNVEVPASQFEKALDGEILFDGSSIEGFARIEESDMLLRPDLATYQLDPFPSTGLGGRDHGRVARLICDVHRPMASPFAGCPRLALKAQSREGRRARLRVDGRSRGRVLSVSAHRSGQADDRDARLGRVLRPGADGSR